MEYFNVYRSLAGAGRVFPCCYNYTRTQQSHGSRLRGEFRVLAHDAAYAGYRVLLCVDLGLGQVVETFPGTYTVLKFAGTAYLIYLAWRIVNAGPVKGAETVGQPLSFLEAPAFQWVNPKAWVMALNSMAIYTLPMNYWMSMQAVVLIFFLVALPSVSLWCGMGQGLIHLLSDSRRLRAFNIAMVVLLFALLWPMLA
jgi:threonine/homoserine/homoserine lactone efflux protein